MDRRRCSDWPTREELEQFWRETLDRAEGPVHPIDLVVMLPPRPVAPPLRKLVLVARGWKR